MGLAYGAEVGALQKAFTYSSGIIEFNPFINAIVGVLNITALYNSDPAKAVSSVRPIDRWKNETFYAKHKAVNLFEYLHNFCLPQYTLHLGFGD